MVYVIDGKNNPEPSLKNLVLKKIYLRESDKWLIIIYEYV